MYRATKRIAASQSSLIAIEEIICLLPLLLFLSQMEAEPTCKKGNDQKVRINDYFHDILTFTAIG
jgi:hypothetical protein